MLFHRKSEEEKVFEQLDTIEAAAEKSKSPMLRNLALNYRRVSFAINGLYAKTLVEVMKNLDNPEIMNKWALMEDKIKKDELHPREVYELYNSLKHRRNSK